jgi:hypothetical protein
VNAQRNSNRESAKERKRENKSLRWTHRFGVRRPRRRFGFWRAKAKAVSLPPHSKMRRTSGAAERSETAPSTS